MLNYLTMILCCQLAGELIAKGLQISIPGPVIGMVFLFVFLLLRGSVPDNLAKTADTLLAHLSLLFVPAGVGVILHFRLLGNDLIPIGASLVFSTLLIIAVTAWMMNWLGPRDAQPEPPQSPQPDEGE
ncbi:MAG: CidA/LrgA family protein [Fimbriimonadaceae bacterium]|nr:CidA/LrgA family protein [Alphaproteobacteria bacterium]